ATNCATPGYLLFYSLFAGSPKPPALPTALHPDIDLPIHFSPVLPNHPRYQLRYTRIFTFSVSENFTVCGQSCGQMQFWGTFQWAVKSSNSPCSKGFRRFGFARLGYRHGTPKAGAVPTPLHPVI
ncbi:MAG: hypothetical protein PHD67_07605, partial [Oscillospiraceae bacterium]|nr:hypothetical protein [Oscillospiraceae bacterium]